MPKFQYLVEIETSDARSEAKLRTGLKLSALVHEQFHRGFVFYLPRGVPEKALLPFDPQESVERQIADPSPSRSDGVGYTDCS